MKLKYYSHSKSTYNTKKEELERDFLIKTFGAGLVCPNLFLNHLNTNEEFQFWIKKCNILFVSDVDGYLSYGSYSECRFAKLENIVVMLLHKVDGKFKCSPVKDVVKVVGQGLKRAGKVVL